MDAISSYVILVSLQVSVIKRSLLKMQGTEYTLNKSLKLCETVEINIFTALKKNNCR